MKLSRRLALGYTLILLLSLLCYGQEKLRKVERASKTKNEPIELVSSHVGEQIPNTENQVLADKDWLKNLKLNLKNISNKTIVYMELELEVQPIGKMERPLRLPLYFGQKPTTTLAANSTTVDVTKSKALKHNEDITVSLQSKDHSFLMQFMDRNEIEDIERVKVFFEFIVFEDGTAWSKGHEMRRNINNKKQWDVIGMPQKEAGLLQNRFMLNTTQSVEKQSARKQCQPDSSMNSPFFLQII